MEWDRFMRFMERYAEDNGLGFEGCVAASGHLDCLWKRCCVARVIRQLLCLTAVMMACKASMCAH